MIIVHYHLFKNAGTSVDALLKKNFPESWAEQEFEIPKKGSNRGAVRDFLLANPKLRALSSHTALLPVPEIPDHPVFPIVFVRHPVLRIQSAYRFEAKQKADNASSRLAASTDFAGYISKLLETQRPTQVRNFQSYRLSFIGAGTPDLRLSKALRALYELPFVGLVEEYERSIERLAGMLAPHFPDFDPLVVQHNVTEDLTKTAEARLAEVRDQLGDKLYANVLRANAEDLVLYETARRMFYP